MHLLLVDGNSVGHASHATTVLTTPKGFQTQAVYGFLRTMRLILEARPAVTPIVLWDGRAQFRFDLFPDYKGKRQPGGKPDPQAEARRAAYQAQVPYIQMFAKLLGLSQITHDDLEADDLAGSLTNGYVKRGDSVTLVSGDKDWLQLVGPNVDWLDPIYDRNPNREVVTEASFSSATGYYNPKSFLEGKVLRGDSSDCIPGVGGIGEKGAPEFLAAFGSIKGFYDQVKSGAFIPRLKRHKDLLTPEGRANVVRNLKLMRLDPNRPIPNEGLHFGAGDYNEDQFMKLCGHLAFASILNDLENYLRPYRAMKLKKAA